MKIIKIQSDEKTKLQALLSKVISSFSGKYVAFAIQSHSGEVGTILMTVSGRRGMVQKSIVVVKSNDEEYEWYAYTNGYQFNLSTITELSSIIKSQIQTATTVLTKI